MKKFISSILILGFTIMPMSYVAFAQEETEIVGEVQIETEAIQEGVSAKEQKSLDTQEDTDIGKQSGDLKEDEDTQTYTEEIQYEIMPESTQQDAQEEKLKDIQKDVQNNENSKSFQIPPETKNKLKKFAAVLPLFVAKKCVGILFNYLTKSRYNKLKDVFNDCSKATVETCWSNIKSTVSIEEAGTKFKECKALTENIYCANEYKSMENAERLGFAFMVVKFLFDTYNIVSFKNFR